MPYSDTAEQLASQRRLYRKHIDKYRTEEYRSSAKERMRLRREANPEPEKEAGRKWRAKTKERRLDYHLRKNYGITLEQRDQMFLDQGSKCAVCKTDSALKWHVDHCHETSAVRGILCSHCNLMIGHAKDNSKTLLSAAEYLNAKTIIRR